jgi:acyl dehydratase
MPRTVYARESRFGGYLEDYEVGDVFHHWPGKTITEAEDHQFCLLTMAINPLHTDVHYAETEMEGGRNIVVGTYIYALLLGMSVPDISGRAIANLGAEQLRHVAPFHHGDTLYGMTEVTGVRPSQSRPGAGVLTVDTTGTNQDGVVVCTFTRSLLVPRRLAQ